MSRRAIYFIKILIAILVGAGISVLVYYITSNKKSDSEKFNNAPAYKLTDSISGNDLVPDSDPSSSKPFLFFNKPDPTWGSVNYGPHTELFEVINGKVKISAGPLPSMQKNENGHYIENRKMIRMTSKKKYNSGLFIISADHMPEGNGVWPAFWLSAPDNWACDGEIDIIEGVNSTDSGTSYNATALHTNDKVVGGQLIQCRQSKSTNGSTDCSMGDGMTCGCKTDANGKGTERCPTKGCGLKMNSPVSFGNGFNKVGGGIYATELTPDGFINIWFFKKGDEPSDINSDSPDPSKWVGTSRVTYEPCPGQFANLQMILNTCLCGAWAGDVFNGGINKGGGIDKCNDYIQTADLSNAYWLVNYIKVFMRADSSNAPIIPSGTCYGDGEDPFGGVPCSKGQCCPGTNLCFHPKQTGTNYNNNYTCQSAPCTSNIKAPPCGNIKTCKQPMCV